MLEDKGLEILVRWFNLLWAHYINISRTTRAPLSLAEAIPNVLVLQGLHIYYYQGYIRLHSSTGVPLLTVSSVLRWVLSLTWLSFTRDSLFMTDRVRVRRGTGIVHAPPRLVFLALIFEFVLVIRKVVDNDDNGVYEGWLIKEGKFLVFLTCWTY